MSQNKTVQVYNSRATYSAEEQQAIIESVLALMPEMSVAAACRQVGVAQSNFKRWVDAGNETKERYARAREDFVYKLADEIIEIGDRDPGRKDDGSVDNGAVQHQRLMVDNRKWLLSKVAPKQFGDRLTVAGDDDAPLKVERVERIIISPTKAAEGNDQ